MTLAAPDVGLNDGKEYRQRSFYTSDNALEQKSNTSFGVVSDSSMTVACFIPKVMIYEADSMRFVPCWRRIWIGSEQAIAVSSTHVPQRLIAFEHSHSIATHSIATMTAM
jgi:hypothetical protein